MSNKRIDIFRVALQTYDGAVIDITNNVASLNIFESINSFYLEGKMTIVDNSAILSDLNIIGQERIIIHLAKDEKTVTKVFRVAQIMDVGRISEHTGAFVLALVSELAFNNASTSFSRHFSGLNSTIIKNIMKDYLDIEINLLSKGGYSCNIVFPYIKPIDAIGQILSSTYASDGTPMYLYERLWEDDIVLISLSDLLAQQEVIQLTNGAIIPDEPGYKAMNKENQIEEFHIVSAYDTLSMLHLGTFASTSIDADISNKSITTEKYDWKKNIIPTGQNWVLADFNTKTEASIRTGISSSLSNSNLPGLSSTEDLSTAKRDSYSRFMASYNGSIRLDNNAMISAGVKVDAKFPRFLPWIEEGDAPSHQVFDHINSGEFLVAGLNHVLELDGGRMDYYMVLDIIRDGVGE